MDSKHSTLQVVWRVALLMLAMGLFLFSLQQERWFATAAASGLLVVLSGFLIVRYTLQIRREWAQFLLSIHEKDYQQYPVQRKGRREDPLHQAFATVSESLREARIEKEVQFHFLQSLVNHLQLAMISFRSDGKIYFMNKAFCELFQVPEVSQLSRLRTWNNSLYHILQTVPPTKEGVLHLTQPEPLQLAMRRSHFRLQEESFTIVSLQDIKKELDAGEMASWQKLTRVLTHEIMNSVTPLSSLSVEAVELLDESREAQGDEKHSLQRLLHQSLTTIASRSRGLLQFVKRYKQFSHPPAPQLESVSVFSLVKAATHLLHRDFEIVGIELTVTSQLPSDQVLVDKQLMEQVFINVLVNAKEALLKTEKPRIGVIMAKFADELEVWFVDNGCGMSDEVLQKAFVPFYTTRDQGSGIGLSLSRQIVLQHHGHMQLKSRLGEGTSVTIRLPQVPQNAETAH
jgi:nitrogen fixation/metabolism regulation signal transduction histidine kinase